MMTGNGRCLSSVGDNMDGSGITIDPVEVGDIIPYGVTERYGFLKLKKRVVIKPLRIMVAVSLANGFYHYYEGIFDECEDI